MLTAVIGLGRMGQRRVADLVTLGYRNVLIYDASCETRMMHRYNLIGYSAPLGGIPYVVCNTLDEVWSEQPDCVFISTPPDSHISLALQAREAGAKAIFIEKPLALTMPSDEELARLAGCVTMVGCNWRYQSVVADLARRIKAGQYGPFTSAVIAAQYPLWEARGDYRTCYAAEVGATLDVGSHLVDLALNWFGPARLVDSQTWGAEVIDLPEIDGMTALLLEHQGGIQVNISASFIHTPYGVALDVHGKGGFHCYRIGAPGEPPGPEMFVEEMRAFLAAAQGEQPSPNPVSQAVEVLRLLLEAKGRWNKS